MPAPRLVRCALLLACAALVLSVPARSEEPLTTEALIAEVEDRVKSKC